MVCGLSVMAIQSATGLVHIVEKAEVPASSHVMMEERGDFRPLLVISCTKGADVGAESTSLSFRIALRASSEQDTRV